MYIAGVMLIHQKIWVSDCMKEVNFICTEQKVNHLL